MNKSLEAQKWEAIQQYIMDHFQIDAQEDAPDADIILYLIGVRELGKGYKKYRKDDKMNLMHVAVCRLLTPFGYYKFQGVDNQGWPHYKLQENLPLLSSSEQTILIKSAIIQYFDQESILPSEYQIKDLNET